MKSKYYLLSAMFFIMGFINISFAIIGLLCIVIPFADYKFNRSKKWCSTYCPRKSVFVRILAKLSLNLKVPKFLKTKQLKEFIFNYFLINLMIVFLTTVMVSIGRINPVEQVRLFIVFPVTSDLFQLVDFELPSFVIHLGYRIYSMMLSSLVIGSVMALFLKPQTWCSVCPVTTWTTNEAKKAKEAIIIKK